MRHPSIRLATVALLGAASCAAPPPGSPPPAVTAPVGPPTASLATLGLASVTIEGIPHVTQRPDFCGEACVEMAERKLGRDVNQDDVFAASKVDPALGRGAVTKELADGARALGFDVGAVWYSANATEPVAGLDAQFVALHQDLVRGVPSIVCMHFSERAGSPEHFRLVVGYEADTDQIVYLEPAEDEGYRRMPRARLYELWPLKYDAATWTLIRIPLAPTTAITPSHFATGLGPADYAEHVRSLKEHLAPGFNVRVELPFVVVGNEPPALLASQARTTVRWAVDHLHADFFDASPREILDVWLFADADSYEAGVTSLTGEAPTTPYGFYSSAHKGLFMNIATGGGTLVHEIVHPFVEADLPRAPAWVNEGLGSLFEQSGERNGHIVGFPNWRLPALQRTIRKGTTPTLSALAHTTTHAFYDDDRGTNYAEARYLMYYLQEKGLLQTFYKTLRANIDTDPTGYATLVTVLGNPDMEAFQHEWETFVSAIVPP